MAEYQQIMDMTTQQISGTVLRRGDCHSYRTFYAGNMPAKMYDTCTLPGCNRRHLAKGYCRIHYERLKRTGSTEDSLNGKLQKASLLDHFSLFFKASVAEEGGCLLWAGSRDLNGYGRIRKAGTNYKAHRLAYEQFKGTIPIGMEVCHSCDNPPCVNPDHLFVGTTKDNALDRQAKGRGRHELKLIEFSFVSPTGEVVSGVGLTRFCAERGLLQPKMTEVMKGRRPHHKGWTKHG